MGMRQRIEDKIRKKEQEIQDHECLIRDAKIYIEALRETLKMLPKDDAEIEKPENKLRPGSKIAKVYTLLKTAKRPMHVSVLLEGIGEQNTKKNRVSLTGSLGVYIRADEIFTRPSPNTFGLKEINGTIVTEPPDDFGLPVGTTDPNQN